MSSPSKNIWSNNPNAPQITPLRYRWEKAIACGVFITAILYGMVADNLGLPLLAMYFLPFNSGIIIVLFYRCMAALLGPVNRRKGVEWGLVAHTLAMFSFLTTNVCMNLDLQSISYVDNREFPGVSAMGPGPFAYQYDYLSSDPMNTVPETLFLFNTWLADGLLVWSMLGRGCFVWLIPPALPLPHYLFYELLGDSPSVPVVPRFH